MPLPLPIRSDEPTRLDRGRTHQRARRAAALLASLLAASLGGPARAELYRWVDETGSTVYSQRRPSSEVPATVIETQESRPATGPETGQPNQADKERQREAIEREFDQREENQRLAGEAARKAAEEAAKKADEQANRQRICDAARHNLETLENHGGGRLRMPDGTERFLSRDELATLKEQTGGQIQDNCD